MTQQVPILRDRISATKDRYTSIGVGIGLLLMAGSMVVAPPAASLVFSLVQVLAAGAVGGVVMRVGASIIAPLHHSKEISKEGHPIVSSGDMSITHTVESPDKRKKLHIGNGKAKSTIMVEQSTYEGRTAPTEHGKSIF